ncbi:MAG: alcohol dehydrogenase catalytic domain-containing protein, partial [Actinomycetota bacterium]
MKAAVYDKVGGPEVFRYAEVDEPQLRRGGVLIDVAAIGIQGGDTLHRQGGVLASVPHIVGYQAAGIVRVVGEGVSGIEPGQPVVATMGNGSHAEVVSVPAGAVWAVPEGLSLRGGAGVPIVFGT